MTIRRIRYTADKRGKGKWFTDIGFYIRFHASKFNSHASRYNNRVSRYNNHVSRYNNRASRYNNHVFYQEFSYLWTRIIVFLNKNNYFFKYNNRVFEQE